MPLLDGTQLCKKPSFQDASLRREYFRVQIVGELTSVSDKLWCPSRRFSGGQEYSDDGCVLKYYA